MLDQINEIKRQRILDAAMRIFSERGFHHATVSEVAQAAHVGKGTLYLYFHSKEALLVALFDELADRLLATLDRVLGEGTSLREAVYRLVEEQVDNGTTKKQILRLLSQQPFLANLSLQREKRALVRRVIERVARGVRAATDRGRLRPCDPNLCSCLLLSLPGVISLYESVESEGSLPERVSRAAAELADVLWNGIKKEGVA